MPLPYACPMQYQGPVPAVCTITVAPCRTKEPFPAPAADTTTGIRSDYRYIRAILSRRLQRLPDDTGCPAPSLPHRPQTAQGDAFNSLAPHLGNPPPLQTIPASFSTSTPSLCNADRTATRSPTNSLHPTKVVVSAEGLCSASLRYSPCPATNHVVAPQLTRQAKQS